MKIKKGAKIGIWWILFGLSILALGIRGIYWNQSPGLHMLVPTLDISGNLVFGLYFVRVGVLFITQAVKVIVDIYVLSLAVLTFSILCVCHDLFLMHDIEIHYFLQIEYLAVVLVSTSINFLKSRSEADNEGIKSVFGSNIKRSILIMTIPSFLALLINELFLTR